MRSDSPEVGGSMGRARTQVLARWVSVGRVAGLWDVGVSYVRRFEAAGGFGAGNSRVMRAPGSSGPGELRIRASAVNRTAELEAGRRELDRAAMAERWARNGKTARVERPGGVEVWNV